jgi:hypothetical protein
MNILKLPYLVAFVIPSLGRKKNQTLKKEKRQEAIEITLKELEGLFGGATTMESRGVTRMLDGTVLVDHEQTLVLTGTTRKEFLSKKAAIEKVAVEVGKMLDQEAVAVLAYDSDSYIVELRPEERE